jgi:hypothetical protein
MVGVRLAEPVKTSENGKLDANTEAHVCETCYEIIVDFGIDNVLAAVGRAARVRAGDYLSASRRQYLRHQRAAARILAACQEIVRDAEQVDRIVAEERVSAARQSDGARASRDAALTTCP